MSDACSSAGLPDCLSDCRTYRHSCGERPMSVSGSHHHLVTDAAGSFSAGVVPSPIGVHRHNRSWRTDVPCTRHSNTQIGVDTYPRSMSGGFHRAACLLRFLYCSQLDASKLLAASDGIGSFHRMCRVVQRCLGWTTRRQRKAAQSQPSAHQSSDTWWMLGDSDWRVFSTYINYTRYNTGWVAK